MFKHRKNTSKQKLDSTEKAPFFDISVFPNYHSGIFYAHLAQLSILYGWQNNGLFFFGLYFLVYLSQSAEKLTYFEHFAISLVNMSRLVYFRACKVYCTAQDQKKGGLPNRFKTRSVKLDAPFGPVAGQTCTGCECKESQQNAMVHFRRT